MYDAGEVRADGEIRQGDQIRRCQLQERDGLDQGHELLANPAI